ncbi:MAG TPA: BTAD domain-containing putative transcriptional regulator [Blastocatellia bacterium]|nr:BTAD domain-containing putative transcriptional regulator [Blastocatellia bacterium]
MPTLKAHLFGKFRILHNEQVWHTQETCKVRELLCYLLFYRSMQHRREQLAGLLWGESSAAQSKKYLRQTLWQVQAACNLHLGLSSERLVLANAGRVYINPEIDLQTDVAEFQQAYTCLQAGVELAPESARRVNEAVELYQGDLLEGWHSDWCIYEREHLQNKYLMMLDKLVLHYESQREYEAGLNYAARILQCDPARERAHQQMMRLHYLAGDRTAALRQFDNCAETLRKELDVRPSKGTLLLYEQIRADQFEQITSSPIMLTEPETPPSLPAVLTKLKQLHEALTGLQRQLQQEIQMVERYLPALRDQR